MANLKMTTPPKGWNSWDVYGASVTESEVKENAAYMAENLLSAMFAAFSLTSDSVTLAP